MMVPAGGSVPAMSSSFSAPTGLADAASPTSENGGGRPPSSSSTPASTLQRSNSTMSSTSTTTTSSKMENIRSWSISTYKCTKQLLAEKLGKSSRTVDTGQWKIQNRSFVYIHEKYSVSDSTTGKTGKAFYFLYP
ncbi:hypothetical protein FHG87_021948 [Trinorchestia longiramus]|nr:hypothetical protein FHG87_021948 [Trinorchestia longiramus]